MIHAPCLAGLLLALTGAQDPALLPQDPGAPADPAPSRSVAGVAAIVNDDVVTLARLARNARELRKRIEVSTPEDLEQLNRNGLIAAIFDLLRTQSGEDMGLPPEEVRLRVESVLSRRREDRGLFEESDYLRSLGLDSAGARQNTEALLHQRLWLYSITGRGPGPRGRVYRDRFVRPGELNLAYQEGVARSGARDQVVIQILEIRCAAAGGCQQAQRTIEDLRRQARDGADFAELVDEYSSYSRNTGSISQPIAVESLGHPMLRLFAASATAEDLSEVLPVENESGVVAYWVVRVLERQAGTPAPPFSAREMQAELTKRVLGAREERWMRAAEESLLGRAWLWPENLGRSR